MIIPPWALILLQCMKGVINGLKVIDDLVHRVIILEDFKTVNEINVINKLEMSVDDQEQRSRNMCLIHGVEEKDGEKTDELVLNVINNDLGIVNTNITEIQRSHRLGPKKPQPKVE